MICLWIWIGTKQLLNDVSTPWILKNPGLGKGSTLYLFVLYWTFTVTSTVGYGDFTGGTTGEYLVTIVFEYVGMLCFAVLALLVNQLIDSGLTYEKFISNKFTVLEEWIVKVEHCNLSLSLEPS